MRMKININLHNNSRYATCTYVWVCFNDNILPALSANVIFSVSNQVAVSEHTQPAGYVQGVTYVAVAQFKRSQTQKVLF